MIHLYKPFKPIENGALSNVPNAKYLANFIVKMADHLKK